MFFLKESMFLMKQWNYESGKFRSFVVKAPDARVSLCVKIICFRAIIALRCLSSFITRQPESGFQC
jgi:hypothetical protein